MSRAVAFAISRMRKLIVAKCATTGATRYVPVAASRSLYERAMHRTLAQHLHDAPDAATADSARAKLASESTRFGHAT